MKSILSICLLLAAITAGAITADSFRLVKQDGRVSLYERWLKYKDGDVREIKTTFIVHSDLNSLVSILSDAQKGARWNMNTACYKIVPAGKNSWINYIKYSLPWPFDDQDCCLQYYISAINDQRAEVVFSSIANERFPVHKGISRITGIKGSWVMERRNDGCVSVTYTIISDHSTNVPRCISDAAVHNNLFKSITALTDIVEKR